MLIQLKLTAHRDLKSIEIRGNRTFRQFVMERWKHHSIHYTHNRVMCTCSIAIGAHTHVTHHCNGTCYASLQRHCHDNQHGPLPWAHFPGVRWPRGYQISKNANRVQMSKNSNTQSPLNTNIAHLDPTPLLWCVCARAHTHVSVFVRNAYIRECVYIVRVCTYCIYTWVCVNMDMYADKMDIQWLMYTGRPKYSGSLWAWRGRGQERTCSDRGLCEMPLFVTPEINV